MAIRIGTSTPSKLYFGSTEVTKIYLGASEVYSSGPNLDSDAQAYITAVETADGQALEQGVKTAINDFVVGCKADGIWASIKASTILAGARTLTGALTPLAGTAPTNFNFVSGDYHRKTGLLGNGSTKYLDSNRNNNADPQDDRHLSIYKSVAPSSNTSSYMAAQITSPVGSSSRISDNSNTAIFSINSGSPASSSYNSQQLGFLGVSRANSSNIAYRANTTTTTAVNSSNFHIGINTLVFARSVNGSANQFTNARLSFYSIGESLDLALLDTRVSNLITAIGVAIP